MLSQMQTLRLANSQFYWYTSAFVIYIYMYDIYFVLKVAHFLAISCIPMTHDQKPYPPKLFLWCEINIASIRNLIYDFFFFELKILKLGSFKMNLAFRIRSKFLWRKKQFSKRSYCKYINKCWFLPIQNIRWYFLNWGFVAKLGVNWKAQFCFSTNEHNPRVSGFRINFVPHVCQRCEHHPFTYLPNAVDYFV